MDNRRLIVWLFTSCLLWNSGCSGYRVTVLGVELDRLAESRMVSGDGREGELTAAYHNDLGVLFEREGNLKEALKQYRLAREIDPGLVVASINAGNVWIKLDNLQQAVSCYRFALEREPDHPRALNNLAWVYILMGEQLDEAVSLLKKAIASDPDHRYRYLDSLGWAYYLKGETETGLKTLLSALEETPGEETHLLAETHYHLGRIYHSRDNYEQAGLHFAKSLELNPSPQREDEINKLLAALNPETRGE